MDGLDTSRLVLILSKEPDQAAWRFGTGYFLTETSILTASHVIPELSSAVVARVEKTGERHEARVVGGKVSVIWRDPQLDVVLFDVAPGIAKPEAMKWMEVMPRNDVPWRSTGYPSAATESDGKFERFTTAGLAGKLYSQGGGGQSGSELDLGVEDGAVPQSWRGISGAPVFVDNQLAGIIVQVPNDFKGGRLRGIRAPTLLANASFREAIEPRWLTWPNDRSWVLVVKSEQPAVDLPPKVAGAIRRFNDQYLELTGGPAFSPQPVDVAIEDALASPGRWLQLIRALCAAPVMIADVTQFQPAVMVALGVRAVVRRAVTITSTAEYFNETHFMNLPFNIQETKLLYHGRPKADRSDAVTVIGESMRDGLLEFRHNSRYLDLPAYDAVRCAVPKFSATQNSVLVLCPFHPDYVENWITLRESIATLCSPKEPKRMLDIGSPRLVGQALYEAIRWTPICIVDWSRWRPNVFFELGVRLACSNTGPLSIIDSADANRAGSVQAERLRTLFRPAMYDRENPDNALNSAWQAHEREVSGDTSGLPSSGLTHDATHQLATANFEWEADESTIEPQRLLRASVEDSIGKDPQQLGMPAVLFSKGAFQKRIESSARERWIAAWYYLRYRYADDLKGNDDLVREFERVGENLLSSLAPDTQDNYLMALKEEVIGYIPTLKAPGPSSKVLNVSDGIRELKTQAKNRRDLKLYDLAVPILENAINLAKPNLDNSEMRSLMAVELADCYGLLGGVERRWALSTNAADDRAMHLRESIKAYDEAWKFESGDYGLKTSYGMMNRLVSRLLLKPASLDEQAESEFGEGVTPLAVRQALGDARGLIESQLKLRDDWWAAADLALAKLLLREGDPARAYAGFLEKSPPDHALKSVLDILQPLADLSWPLASALTQAKAVIEAAAKKLATAE